MNIKRLILMVLVCLLAGSLLVGQAAVEGKVLQTIQTMFKEGSQVTFSSLYNDDRFSSEEKAFLGRLYEIFFAIPGFLKSEQESTGQIPTRQQMADSFGVSTHSIGLLLTVMASDPRMPSLFERAPGNGEITSLNTANIDTFMKSRGAQVKFTQWEGQPLPAFTLTSVDGEAFSSTALEGKNSLLYFWFTGCPPCVRITPILAELNEKYGSGSGITFVGLNADTILDIGTTDADRKAYAEKQGLHFVTLNVDAPAREAFGNVNVYPTLFLVDKSGTVRHHLVNFQSREKLEGILQAMLAGGE